MSGKPITSDAPDSLRPLRPILPNVQKPKSLPPMRPAEDKKRIFSNHQLQTAEDIDKFVSKSIESMLTNDVQTIEPVLQTLTEELEDDLESILDEIVQIVKEGGKVPEKYSLFVPKEETPITQLHVEHALREVTKLIAGGNMKESLKAYIALCQSKGVPYRRVDYSLMKDKAAAQEADPDSSYSTDAFSDIHQELCAYYLSLVHTKNREAIFSASLLLPCHVIWNQYIFERHQVFDKLCTDVQNLSLMAGFVDKIASFLNDDLDMMRDFCLALQSDGFFTDRQNITHLISDLYVSYIEKRLFRSYQMIINAPTQNSKSSKDINPKEVITTTITIHKIGSRFSSRLKEECLSRGILEPIEKINHRTIFSAHFEKITKSFVGELTRSVEAALSAEANFHNQRGEYMIDESSSPVIAKSCVSILETYSEITYLMKVDGLDDIHPMVTSSVASSIKIIARRLQTSCAAVPDRESIRFLYISYNTAVHYSNSLSKIKREIHPLYGWRSAAASSRTIVGLDEALFTLEAIQHELLTRVLDIHRDNLRACVLSGLSEANFEEQKDYMGGTRCSYPLYSLNYYLKSVRFDLETYSTQSVTHLVLSAMIYESTLLVYSFYNSVTPTRARMNHYKADLTLATCILQSFVSWANSYKSSELMQDSLFVPRQSILGAQTCLTYLLGILSTHFCSIPTLCSHLQRVYQSGDLSVADYSKILTDPIFTPIMGKTEPKKAQQFNPIIAMKEVTGEPIEHSKLLSIGIDWDKAISKCPLPKDLLVKTVLKRHELREDYPPLSEEDKALAEKLRQTMDSLGIKK